MKKAVIYGRVSSKDDRQNYEYQISLLNDHAKRNNLKIVETFSEKVSASKTKQDERPEFNEMIAFIEKNNIKNILVTELSRIGRNGVYTHAMVEDLKKKGINVYIEKEKLNTLNEDGTSNQNAEMWIAIRAQMDKQEVETQKFRIKNGLKFSAKDGGGFYGKTPPYGFKNENRKWVLVPEEVEVVKDIYNQYTNGNGTRKIVNYLNNKGIKTRYQKAFGEKEIKTRSGGTKKGNEFIWKPISVQQILKNRLYIGERWLNGQLMATFDPIIDRTQFNKVQQILKNNINKTNKIKNVNYLKGIIKCSMCGQTMQMKKVSKENSDTNISQYTCIGTLEKKCTCKSINIERTEEMLYNIFKNEILQSIKSKSQNEINSIIKSKEIDIFNVESEMKKYESKLNKLYESYEENLIPKSIFENRKKKLDDDNKDNQKKLDELKNDVSNYKTSTASDLKNIYTKKIFLENIKSIIKLVEVGDVEKSFLKKVNEFGKHAQQVRVTTLLDTVINIFQSRYKNMYIVTYGMKGKPMLTRKLNFSDDKQFEKNPKGKYTSTELLTKIGDLLKNKSKKSS